jgi:hypothetical protein
MIKSSLYGLSLGGKTPGNEIATAAKKLCVEVRRPLWIDQPQAPVKMHGGYNPAKGWPWFSGRWLRPRLGSGGQEKANEEDATTSLSCVTTQLLLC